MLDSWSLQILVTVAERGSFSAAASDLLLTQPAVSRQIASLERTLKVPLFRREPRGVSLTPAGETAVHLARELLAHVTSFEATMRSFEGLAGGRVKMSGFASVNTHFVPEVIRRFADAHPDVSATLHHVDPLDALVAVREGRVDVALVTEWQLGDDPARARGTAQYTTPHSVPVVDRVELTPLLDEELRIALPTNHRLANETSIELTDLRDERWVDGAYPDCLGPLSQLAEILGSAPQIAYFCDDWNGKQALVAGGAGIMVVPTLARAAIRSDLVLHLTSPPLPARRLFAATAKRPFRTPAADMIVEMLQGLAAGASSRNR